MLNVSPGWSIRGLTWIYLAVSAYILVITIESPHRTLKISSAGPRLCEWTGDGCRVPSAGPISSCAHNLAHLTSHHLHIKTLRLLSARPRIRSTAGWSLVRSESRVLSLVRSESRVLSLVRKLLIGHRIKGGTNLVCSLMAVMGVYSNLFRMNLLSLFNAELLFFWDHWLYLSVHTAAWAAWKFSRGHFYNFISLPLNIKMIYIQ